MVTVRLFGMTKLLAGNQGTLSLALHGGNRVKDLVAVIEVDLSTDRRIAAEEKGACVGQSGHCARGS